jgi:GDP-L-fucose synthase
METMTAASAAVPLSSRIFVAGHRGLVGSAIVRRLEELGYENILVATRDQLDLRDQAAVNYWFRANRPEYVYLVAGTVGGILANSTRPAEFIYDNMMIHATVVQASHEFGTKKLLYLGSSCIYPREADQPITEAALLTAPLEPTNEAYAIAKIAGIKLCQSYRRQYQDNFISAMPTNLYGPNDNFDLTSSHVLPAMIRKFHEAKLEGRREVEIWGTGSPRREFLHVDDLASACVFLMDNYEDEEHINVGTGEDLTIRALAELIGSVVHPDAELVFDTSKPDGTPRKLLDVGKLFGLGWRPQIPLEEGIRSTYQWFLEHESGLRGVRPGDRRVLPELVLEAGHAEGALDHAEGSDLVRDDRRSGQPTEAEPKVVVHRVPLVEPDLSRPLESLRGHEGGRCADEVLHEQAGVAVAAEEGRLVSRDGAPDFHVVAVDDPAVARHPERIGLLRRRLGHGTERAREVEVVRVEPADKLALCEAVALVQGVGEAAIRLRHHLDLRVSGHELEGAIRGPAVDDHVLEVRVPLRPDAGDRALDRRLRVQAGRHHADPWQGPGCGAGGAHVGLAGRSGKCRPVPATITARSVKRTEAMGEAEERPCARSRISTGTSRTR